jgi:NTE family protein
MGARQDRSGDRPRRPNGAATEPDPSRGGQGAVETKTINLALQGGGAHGAFAWGVLDKLLEDGRIAIEGISATSAGAMNATVLAYGWAEGGSDGARAALDAFWRRIAQAASASPLQPSLVDRLTHNHGLYFSPAFQTLDLLVRVFSPYQFNPLNFNPLQHILEQSVDFARLRASSQISLFLSATNVRSGKVRVFRNAEITPAAVMASACLPFLFQAVEIDGEAYWDGGYMGNPAIFPFFDATLSEDVLIVQINPVERNSTPHTQTEIMNRINEISFNSSLLAEFRAIDFVTRLIDQGKLPRGMGKGEYRRINVHRIALDDTFKELTAGSKLDSDFDFFELLKKGGAQAARNFLSEHFDDIGKRSTIDLGAEAKAEWA